MKKTLLVIFLTVSLIANIYLFSVNKVLIDKLDIAHELNNRTIVIEHVE